MGTTSEDQGFEWTGLPSPAAVRAAAGLLLAALVAALAAFILGEYEFTKLLPLGAGVFTGLIVAEVAVTVGRRRTLPVAIGCAAFTAAGLLRAGWTSAGEGLAPIPGGAWLAAALGALAAVLRVVGLRRPGRGTQS